MMLARFAEKKMIANVRMAFVKNAVREKAFIQRIRELTKFTKQKF